MKPVCAVRNEKFGGCPETPAWAVNINDDELFLCERCYSNVKGAYPRLRMLAEIPLSGIIAAPSKPSHAE